MKHLLIPLLVFFSFGVCRANDTLTRAQVYDFAVGDTFCYHYHFSSLFSLGNEQEFYYMFVVTDVRYSANGDTVFYNNQPYTNLTDPVIYPMQCSAFADSAVITDSISPLFHGRELNIAKCFDGQSSPNYDTRCFVSGLGMVLQQGEFHNAILETYLHSILLVYYSKGAERWGTLPPDNLIFTEFPVFQSVNRSICRGDSILFGTTLLTDAGVYLDTFIASNGGDSIVTLSLNFYGSSTPVITQINNMLSTGNYSSYRWLWNGTLIPNAVTQSHVPAQNGDYQVITTNGHGCKDTSAVFNVTGVTNLNIPDDFAATLYPNPNTGTFILQLPDDAEYTILIIDILGKTILPATTVRGTHLFRFETLNEGIYFLHVAEKGVLKFVVDARE